MRCFTSSLRDPLAAVPHLLNLLNREETVAKVVPAITRSTAGNPMPPTPPLMKPNTGNKSTLAATLPHCLAKLGLKRLE